MAIASLVMVGLTIAAWGGLTVEERSGTGKTWVTAASGMAVVWGPIAGFVLAVLALLRIKVAQGALRGKRLAIAGLIGAALLIAGIVVAGSQLPIHR